MRRLVLLLFTATLVGIPTAVFAAAEGALEVIDLPPIDISRGDWWVALVVWFLIRYMNGKNARTAR